MTSVGFIPIAPAAGIKRGIREVGMAGRLDYTTAREVGSI